MKKVTVDFPVVGWASVTIEVEDDLSVEDIEQMIENDDIEVPWSSDDCSALFPVLSISDFLSNEIRHSEVPERFEVSE